MKGNSKTLERGMDTLAKNMAKLGLNGTVVKNELNKKVEGLNTIYNPLNNKKNRKQNQNRIADASQVLDPSRQLEVVGLQFNPIHDKNNNNNNDDSKLSL